MIESFKLPNITPETLTGSIVSFTDEYGNLPLKSCTSLISGYQEGSGTPSPSNVRAIHGWSAVDISRTGVNIWDGEYLNGRLDIETGEPNPSASGVYAKNIINVNPNMTLYIYSGFNVVILEYGIDGTYLGVYTICNNSSITLGNNTYYIRFYTTNPNNYIVSLNYPSTDTDYHAYNGNTYTFTFGQTFYQGYIDWLRGVVVGTHGIVDLGSLTWLYNTQYANPLFYTNLVGAKLTPSAQKGDILAEIFETYSAREMNTAGVDYAVAISEPYFFSSFNLYIVDSDYTDPTAFKTAMNGVQLAYELATPITIPLGGINLLTQEGQNNIFCDTGDTEVTHLKVR